MSKIGGIMDEIYKRRSIRSFKDVEYGQDEEVKVEKTIEYIIHKHIQGDENIVVPVAIH